MTDAVVAGGSEALAAVARHLPPIRRRGDAVNATTHALREAILEGDLPMGAWLREESIAEVLGVSRTPLRESLSRLAEEGLVERTAGGGARVSVLSVEDVAAVYQVRGSLESLAAGIAARRADPAVIARLRGLHRDLEAAAEAGDSERFHRVNMQFHAAFTEIGDSRYLSRLLGIVYQAVRRVGTQTFSAARMAEIVDEHAAIVDAVSAGDDDAAVRAASAHAERARAATLGRLLG